METLFEEQGKEKGSKKILLLAAGAAVLAVIALIGLISLKPSQTVVEKDYLQGAFREDSPEFQTLTKKIVAQTVEDASTTSMTGMGTRMMSIGGTIRNFSGKTLTGLELKVNVVDTFNNNIKERTIIVIPTQQETLENNQVMPVRVNVEGIDPKADIANVHWKVTAIKVAN